MYTYCQNFHTDLRMFYFYFKEINWERSGSTHDWWLDWHFSAQTSSLLPFSSFPPPPVYLPPPLSLPLPLVSSPPPPVSRRRPSSLPSTPLQKHQATFLLSHANTDTQKQNTDSPRVTSSRSHNNYIFLSFNDNGRRNKQESRAGELTSLRMDFTRGGKQDKVLCACVFQRTSTHNFSLLSFSLSVGGDT